MKALNRKMFKIILNHPSNTVFSISMQYRNLLFIPLLVCFAIHIIIFLLSTFTNNFLYPFSRCLLNEQFSTIVFFFSRKSALLKQGNIRLVSCDVALLHLHCISFVSTSVFIFLPQPSVFSFLVSKPQHSINRNTASGFTKACMLLM